MQTTLWKKSLWGRKTRKNKIMLKYLKIGISALALSALFLAPEATVTFVTAGVAYAKNVDGNGGGNRGGGAAGKGADKGRDNGARGNSGSKSAKAEGNSGFKGFGNKGGKNKSASKGGFGKGMKDFGESFKKDVGKLFGVKPSKNTASAGSTKNKAAKSDKAYAGKPEKGPMHPSNLGKLNGYLNSSPNAKLAHIANGQYMKGTGPVSMAAALTVAKYELGVATDAYADEYGFVDPETGIVDENAVREDIAEALHLNDAYGLLDDAGVTEEDTSAIDAARDVLDNPDVPDDSPEKVAAQELVDAYDKVESYQDGGGTREANNEKVAAAGDIATAIDSVTMKEDEALAHYKGDFDDLSMEEQDKVRQALHDSLPQDDTAIHDALERYEEKSMTEEEGMEGGEMADGEEGEMTEQDTDSAMIVGPDNSES